MISSPSRLVACFPAVAAAVLLGAMPDLADAQRRGRDDAEEPAPTIDESTGRVLNEAIEFLNMDDYTNARAAIAELRLDRLSPYERSRVEQILFNIDYSEGRYDSAREHLVQAIAAGGLTEQEVSQLRYQIAQLYMQEEDWASGAAALEEWFTFEPNPNSAAYYLLAVAYYQQEETDKALAPAQKAVELTEQPQASWIELLLALYLQQERYREAAPLLERLVTMSPEKKDYWLRLSSIYQQLEDYPKALAAMQLPYSAGLLTEDADIRRLADMLMFNEVPYRGAVMLERAVADKVVTPDAALYEKLANCWIAARHYEKAIEPLQTAAFLASTGDLYVRLAEVQVQREEWRAAAAAVEQALDKGELKDTAGAQLLMGISLFNQGESEDARQWFQRAASSERHRDMARGYVQLIDSQKN